jgi:predicted RNA-binding Zn-ribbon protein involved in translation (DUF1610 family)
MGIVVTIDQWAEQAPADGPADGETDEEYEARTARLRAAHDEQMRRFACPSCGELGALAPPKDRYHRCLELRT